jgi:hypothetical protein
MADLCLHHFIGVPQHTFSCLCAFTGERGITPIGGRVHAYSYHNVVASGTRDGVVATGPGHIWQELRHHMTNVCVVEDVLLVRRPSGEMNGV